MGNSPLKELCRVPEKSICHKYWTQHTLMLLQSLALVKTNNTPD